MSINSIDSSNPVEIGAHMHEIYNGIFNQNDPYKDGDLQKFLGDEGITKLGAIKHEYKEMCDASFSKYEVIMALNELGRNKNGGPDKVTSELVKFLFKIYPNLIIKVCQNIFDLNN